MQALVDDLLQLGTYPEAAVAFGVHHPCEPVIELVATEFFVALVSGIVVCEKGVEGSLDPLKFGVAHAAQSGASEAAVPVGRHERMPSAGEGGGLLHWFGDFCLRMRQSVQSMAEVQGILEQAFEASKNGKGITREQMTEFRKLLDPKTVKII